MNVTYNIQVIHCDQDAWLADLRRAIAARLMDLGMHRSVNVVVSEAPTAGGSPAVAVYLGSAAAASHDDLIGAIDAALHAGIVVFPVVDDLARYSSLVPPSLRAINGFEWGGPEPEVHLAHQLLEELGIEDRQRRVFISHKREDGLGAAEQLHDALSHTRFQPFIDRFAIRTAQDVQRAIADALEDHAFLLLLETPLAHTSEWVFDEVDYALSHQMGTLILQWPGDPPPVPGSNRLPRLSLATDELMRDGHDYDILVPPAIDRVIANVEDAHAQAIVRRRRGLIRSIEEAAEASGATACVPLRDWRLLVEHPSGATLLGVTPRLPTAQDLQLLDDARAAVALDPSAVLVHSARALRPERASHLGWVAGDRDLELTPENAIGGRWA